MDLSMQLAQKQVLSQKMQQSVEILQMNTTSLYEYMQNLVEENPVLEWKEGAGAEPPKENELLKKLEWLEESDEQNRGFYSIEKENENERDENKYARKKETTLTEYLLHQIHILKVDGCLRETLMLMAESVESSGYLKEDALLHIKSEYSLNDKKLEDAVKIFQGLEPVGIGARSLQECLLIQLHAKGASLLAIEIAQSYLEDLARNKMTGIAKSTKSCLDDVLDAAGEIRDCEPKPGSGFSDGQQVIYVSPDVYVITNEEGELGVFLNNAAAPHIYISNAYVSMVRSGVSEETEDYIANKLRQAEWAMQCISKRESTLLETARSIVKMQENFFMEVDGQLNPLRMMDIAEMMQVHESTISRAVRDKYLQCDRGTFPLSSFFSKALSDEGEGSVSADSIKQKIRQLIEDEDKEKPLSDQQIADILQGEGTQISRRTIAKYRESLGILRTSMRKQYS